MDGYAPRVVGRIPDQVRGQRTTQGARERYTRAPSTDVGWALFHTRKGGTLWTAYSSALTTLTNGHDEATSVESGWARLYKRKFPKFPTFPCRNPGG